MLNKKKILSKTSKMPCKSISLSAWLCRNGEKLSKVKGSVCNGCYARKGFYHMPNVKAKQSLTLEFMQSKEFIAVMVELLQKEKFFRWFDSGDIQDLDMASNILDICEKTPHCKHWIPTKEYKDWKTILKSKSLPSNVALRFSTPMNDTPPLENAPLTTTNPVSIGGRIGVPHKVRLPTMRQFLTTTSPSFSTHAWSTNNNRNIK